MATPTHSTCQSFEEDPFLQQMPSHSANSAFLVNIGRPWLTEALSFKLSVLQWCTKAALSSPSDLSLSPVLIASVPDGGRVLFLSFSPVPIAICPPLLLSFCTPIMASGVELSYILVASSLFPLCVMLIHTPYHPLVSCPLTFGTSSSLHVVGLACPRAVS
ncbi:hypothetical protein GQ43DRAFT_310079 [Delitschia confertaspora ATCC 74209]|uniref:Uncharacterized protein n=1 Tax=Delitschia confertaspora ATCC 74209 TaxID=1513339 RepID=A0A9P4JTL5_9PLEO|nr:hypothetical protein GQ43DRAFT_310079 [Delitschia confertaspora ATCC 74209]